MVTTRTNIAAALTQAVGVSVDERSKRQVSGGSINLCLRYETGRGPIFVKRGTGPSLDALAAEAAGLAALAHAEAVRVPSVIALGACEEGAFLALEWIDFGTATRSS